jgi:2-polyprenyl-3-methyl-5-hydroxy-6-metoxy-1,4-benzoquinol methylase
LPENWDEFWGEWNVGETLKLVKATQLSARTRKIETKVKRHLGSFKDLNVIELGSGVGTQSLAMGLLGAKITLVDLNKNALDRANKIFNKFLLTPTCYQGDIFQLPESFIGKFDISMSFGTIEHFMQPHLRQKSVETHFNLLKKNGLSFISVPNKICPHYRLYSFIITTTKLARGPLEKPFDSQELHSRAEKAGYRYHETFGTSMLEFDYLLPYVFVPVQAQVPSKLDNRYAHSLTLFAIK